MTVKQLLFTALLVYVGCLDWRITRLEVGAGLRKERWTERWTEPFLEEYPDDHG
jgi:hypothetical protein